MRKTILYFFLTFVFLVTCTGCKHEYFNPEEVKFWTSWGLADTVYYANDCNSDIDTMIIRKTSISLPPTRNILNSYNNNFVLGHDSSNAIIEFDLRHDNATYYFTISMWGFDTESHFLDVLIDRKTVAKYSQFPFNARGNTFLRYDGKDIHVNKGKTPFDYFILHQDSTLTEYSINNTIYKKINSVHK